MFQTKFVEKIKTHNFCSIKFFPHNRAVYEIKWKNVVDQVDYIMRSLMICISHPILCG